MRRVGAVAEQALEDDLRVELHRQRLRGADPRDGVRVRAAVTLAAVARCRARIFDVQLHRRQQVVLPDLLRDQLIDRRAVDRDVRTGRLLRFVGAEERRRDPVIGPGRAFRRLGRLRPQAAHDRGLVLDLGQRLRDDRQGVRQRAFHLRLPVARRHAVRIEDADKARLCLPGGRLRGGRRGWNHCLEHGQRERGARTLQERSTLDVLLRYEGHDQFAPL